MRILWSSPSLALMVFARSGLVVGEWNTFEYVGCYSSGDGLSHAETYKWQSNGRCQEQCVPISGQDVHSVMALTKGADCWCGGMIPADGDKVDDEQCDAPCTGYDKDMCGGRDAFSVYLTGLEDDVGTVDESDDDSSSSPDDDDDDDNDATRPRPVSISPEAASTILFQETSVITKAGETIVITAPGQAAATASLSDEETGSDGSDGGGGGPSKVVIAVAIVVGVVALAALIGAAVFFVRRRKRKAVEDEYRRNQVIGSFANDKSHSKSESISDQRLEPSILHRRKQSDGSIADEMDFSRRILQVRNPDDV